MAWYNSLWLWRWLPHGRNVCHCRQQSYTKDFPMKGLFLTLHSWAFSRYRDHRKRPGWSKLCREFLPTFDGILNGCAFFLSLFYFFKAICKDILPLDECYMATLYADKCRHRIWKEGCEFTCCKCDKKFRYILWHIVFNENFIKNKTHIFLSCYKRGRT